MFVALNRSMLIVCLILRCSLCKHKWDWQTDIFIHGYLTRWKPKEAERKVWLGANFVNVHQGARGEEGKKEIDVSEQTASAAYELQPCLPSTQQPHAFPGSREQSQRTQRFQGRTRLEVKWLLPPWRLTSKLSLHTFLNTIANVPIKNLVCSGTIG